MKQLLKQYAGGLILLVLLTALTGACLWSSRPVRLDAAELTPAETLESLPGLELAPGEEIEGQTGLSQYGRLPDGQYRLSFVYWQQAHGDERPLYASYTGLEILDGNYILPTSSP